MKVLRRPTNDPVAEDLRRGIAEISSIVSDLLEKGDRTIAHGRPTLFAVSETIPSELGRRAKLLLEARRLRYEHFPELPFGEPAWDMMLDLYYNHSIGRRLSVTGLCMAACVPMTTALRYVAKLEEKSVIRREASATDGRRFWVDLEPDAIMLLSRYLAEI